MASRLNFIISRPLPWPPSPNHPAPHGLQGASTAIGSCVPPTCKQARQELLPHFTGEKNQGSKKSSFSKWGWNSSLVSLPMANPRRPPMVHTTPRALSTGFHVLSVGQRGSSLGSNWTALQLMIPGTVHLEPCPSPSWDHLFLAGVGTRQEAVTLTLLDFSQFFVWVFAYAVHSSKSISPLPSTWMPHAHPSRLQHSHHLLQEASLTIFLLPQHSALPLSWHQLHF